MSSNHSDDRAFSGDSGNVGVWFAFGILGTFMLAMAAVGIANHTSYEPPLDSTVANSAQGFDMASAVVVNPSGEIQSPAGPHLQAFQDACLTCHSARLPLGQPPFGREKWAEIVKKMTIVYGAPITPEAQSDVVDYILSVRPPES